MDHPTPGPFLGNLIQYELASEDIKKLVKLAFEARQNSYSPYSKFAVGAALICKDGEIFQGCNVENSSYGLSICAEQTAVVKAVSSGRREISAIAVVADSNSFITTPCGKCRQILNEFGAHIEIYCAKLDMKQILKTNISGLLPYAFHLMRKKTFRYPPSFLITSVSIYEMLTGIWQWTRHPLQCVQKVQVLCHRKIISSKPPLPQRIKRAKVHSDLDYNARKIIIKT